MATLIEFIALFIGVIVGFIINLFYLNSVRKFLNGVKERCPKNWKALGEPTLLTTSPTISLRVFLYIIKGSYEALGDAELSAIGQKARKRFWLFLSYLVFLMVLLVAFFLNLPASGWQGSVLLGG